jgi:AICAR transformylase/IMP cyclohydrolase PurH
MDANEGATSFTLRRRLATAAFERTSAYDQAIAAWMTNR